MIGVLITLEVFWLTIISWLLVFPYFNNWGQTVMSEIPGWHSSRSNVDVLTESRIKLIVRRIRYAHRLLFAMSPMEIKPKEGGTKIGIQLRFCRDRAESYLWDPWRFAATTSWLRKEYLSCKASGDKDYSKRHTLQPSFENYFTLHNTLFTFIRISNLCTSIK